MNISLKMISFASVITLLVCVVFLSIADVFGYNLFSLMFSLFILSFFYPTFISWYNLDNAAHIK